MILPAALVKRYKLKKVIIEATELGILIRPVKSKTRFQRKMELLRKKKASIYKEMEQQANDSETFAYYNDPNKTFEDTDIALLEP